ncbi:MAG: DNA polymerase IV [Clostridia bacterium]|jgi:DNA polymerase-4|nr:DNA polymerase IV [Clostridia bacterium]NLV34501.1 DNA polymerase IV [Clostridiaceae bacterium]MDD4501459.1 DNA polymerase IV [Clostridia bacterium]HPB17329.1 DNA polymerase IV [Clostridia bacterium]HQM96157.1 DNA polymerase IV [Clostridia bacterium]
MRDILLVDMNAFFIMCESRRDRTLLEKPAAVAGDPKYRSGIILAANYEARKFGVKVTMTVNEAVKLCPNLVLVKPDHNYYEKCSKQVFELLYEYTPILEINSIDEAWMDVTNSKKLFGSPIDIAINIQNRLKDEMGLWCSIGVSENKFLAKMASEIKKPLGITQLYKSDIEENLWPMPVRNLYGIGKATSEKLNSYGIKTIGDLAGCELNYLVKKFGKYGLYLYYRSKGVDDDPVAAVDSKNLSCGRMETLAHDITDIRDAKKVMAILTESIARTIRAKQLGGSVVSIQIKYNTFKMINRQMRIEQTNLTKDIYNAACVLLENNWDEDKPVRLLGVTISSLNNNDMQLSLDSEVKDKEQKLENTIDKINDKYGQDIIKRGNIL